MKDSKAKTSFLNFFVLTRKSLEKDSIQYIITRNSLKW